MSEKISSEFNINQIGQIAIPVSKLERAVAFYRDMLGMRFLFQAPPGLAFFDCGGVRWMCLPNKSRISTVRLSITRWRIYLRLVKL